MLSGGSGGTVRKEQAGVRVGAQTDHEQDFKLSTHSDSKNASSRHGVEGVGGPCVSGWKENKLGEKGIEGHRSRERGC